LSEQNTELKSTITLYENRLRENSIVQLKEQSQLLTTDSNLSRADMLENDNKFLLSMNECNNKMIVSLLGDMGKWTKLSFEVGTDYSKILESFKTFKQLDTLVNKKVVSNAMLQGPKRLHL